jgi:alpha-amylase
LKNITLFQFFHWYYSAEGNLWVHAKEKAPELVAWGITHVWLPPAYKSAIGTGECGYAVYDLYDLGEFDQKGAVRTRWGTKEEYLDAIKAFHDNGIEVLADVVLNHKHGGDEKEEMPALVVNPDNRNEPQSEPRTIEASTKFTFPGRNNKYSSYQWDWRSFTGTREDHSDEIYLILNEYGNGKWEEMLEDEHGNFDYLMGNDIEFRNPFVREELKQWGYWYMETTGIDGFRLDALKHIHYNFFPEWLDAMRSRSGRYMLCIGEYWRNDCEMLQRYIELTEGRIQLFDVPLHFNFYEASMHGKQYDLRNIFSNTLINVKPELSVTFVDNHDTQPLQSLQSTVEYWFKPLAYALILLREQGLPCVFYPAMYEARYLDKKNDEEIYVELNKVPHLETMLLIRKDLAFGAQHDYFDHANVIGWTREGADENALSGCAVLMSNGNDGDKWMNMGSRHAGQLYADATGQCPGQVQLNENGEGTFLVKGGTVSVWIEQSLLEQYKKG